MSKTTLVIGDTHVPFEHKGYLGFCKRIYKAFKCVRVVHIGDLVDNHAISYHEHDPDGWAPADEMKEADNHLKAWFKAFPKVSLCLGNHDRLPDRKGKTVGLPRRCFRSFRERWGLPKTWKTDFAFVYDNVCYQHYASGKYGYIQAALDNRMNTVTGHLHSSAGVGLVANEKDLIFGMGVGCGINRHTYTFNYGRQMRKKPIISCGIVSATKYGVNAQVFPMELK